MLLLKSFKNLKILQFTEINKNIKFDSSQQKYPAYVLKIRGNNIALVRRGSHSILDVVIEVD